MGCNGDEALCVVKHGHTRQEAYELYYKQSQSDGEGDNQLCVSAAKLLRGVAHRQTGQDIVIPRPEDGNNDDQVGDECKEAGRHQAVDSRHSPVKW